VSEASTYPLTPDLDWVPAGFRLLEAPGRDPSRGNLLLLDPDQPRVLKLYRRRRKATTELGGAVSHRLFEGKRGTSPAARCETERLSLDLWHRQGVPVVRRLDEEPPTWASAHPSLWLEYAPGRRLFDLLVMDPEVPLERKVELVRALAPIDRQRHRRALELEQVLLFHEHPTTKHVLVHGERLLWFDLEGGYQEGFPLDLALAHDVGGVVRSLWRPNVPTCFEDPLPRAYVEAYDDPDLLRQAARGNRGGGLGGYFRRRSDRGRRSTRSKTATLEQLLEHLG
jgi:hypothetical protein